MEQDTGVNRKEKLDKFFTNVNIIQLILKKYLNESNIFKNKNISDFTFVEPSAGNGALITTLINFGIHRNNIIAIDIEPDAPNIVKLDFFKFTYPSSNNIITFMNPPYGFASNIAIKFFNKASLYSDYVWCIVSRVFRKVSVINRLCDNMHLVYDVNMPDNSFLINNKPYNVPACFQVWKRGGKRKKIILRKECEYFYFSKDYTDYDIIIRRVGFNSGKILFKNKDSISPSSCYFIKILKDKNMVINTFNKINFSAKNNTSGPRSISKGELIEDFYNQLKHKDESSQNNIEK